MAQREMTPLQEWANAVTMFYCIYFILSGTCVSSELVAQAQEENVMNVDSNNASHHPGFLGCTPCLPCPLSPWPLAWSLMCPFAFCIIGLMRIRWIWQNARVIGVDVWINPWFTSHPSLWPMALWAVSTFLAPICCTMWIASIDNSNTRSTCDETRLAFWWAHCLHGSRAETRQLYAVLGTLARSRHFVVVVCQVSHWWMVTCCLSYGYGVLATLVDGGGIGIAHESRTTASRHQVCNSCQRAMTHFVYVLPLWLTFLPQNDEILYSCRGSIKWIINRDFWVFQEDESFVKHTCHIFQQEK